MQMQICTFVFVSQCTEVTRGILRGVHEAWSAHERSYVICMQIEATPSRGQPAQLLHFVWEHGPELKKNETKMFK